MAKVRGGITVKPHVQRFADDLEKAIPEANNFGTYNGHSPPEGPTQALDIFNGDNAAGHAVQDRICDFARRNAKRYGVRYVIRRRQIWNIERDGEGWRNQSATGNRTADHFDHVHVTFYATAPGPFEDDQIGRPDPQEDFFMIIIGDAPPERGGGVWQSDGIVRKPVRTGDTWAQLGDDGVRVAKHIGVFDVGTFDDLIDIEAALTARIVVGAGDIEVDYAALARQVADELHGRLAG
jgi:hypothetical protein